MPFRKHLGILMFISAWLHLNFTTTLPQLVANGFDASKIELMLFQWMGEIAWWLLLPLWLTSNDTSVKYMGKWWKRVHRLTYVALFFIFFHVALQQESWMFVIGTVAILEVASWIKGWQRTKASQTVSPTPPFATPA
jgi:sulfoxide reductase heme-binding subunit YedZ